MVEAAKDHLPWNFWCLLDEHVTEADWERAGLQARGTLDGLPTEATPDLRALIPAILTESYHRARLTPAKRAYYRIKPLIPRALITSLRRVYRRRQESGFALDWPVERRYACFQFELMRLVLGGAEPQSASFVNFWPEGKRYAFVLTHDVETVDGLRFAATLADIDAKYGFRSAFYFVPERYGIDKGLLAELRGRGCEIGVHDLRHDGKLFASAAAFKQGAQRINSYLKEWHACGFRAGFTHRHPQWMQQLDIAYDCSFFDTDPYEPQPGGTMSLWPFGMGRFIELPMTLAQDYTLLYVLRETTPALWLRKVEVLREFCGLALLNVHPDYMRPGANLAVYEAFLEEMSARQDSWHALPAQAAEWWRGRTRRRSAEIADIDRATVDLDGNSLRVHTGGAGRLSLAEER